MTNKITLLALMTAADFFVVLIGRYGTEQQIVQSVLLTISISFLLIYLSVRTLLSDQQVKKTALKQAKIVEMESTLSSLRDFTEMPIQKVMSPNFSVRNSDYVELPKFSKRDSIESDEKTTFGILRELDGFLEEHK